MSERKGLSDPFFIKAMSIAGAVLLGIILGAGLTTRSIQAGETSGRGIGLLDAVTRTMEKQPDIHLQEQEVEISKGKLQVAKGQFDAALGISASHERLPEPQSSEARQTTNSSASTLTTDTTSSKVDVTKQFRTGVTISPSVGITRTEITPSGFEPANNAGVDFLVTVPLLKGRGTDATGANEMFAKAEYEISILRLRHLISQDVLNTVLAYWSYLAAKKSLDQLMESESRAERFVRDTKTLIDADEYPASELDQVVANYADKTTLRMAGEQTLLEAKQNLGLAMGVPFDEIQLLPPPTDEFPRATSREIDRIKAATHYYIDRSLLLRADYLAATGHEKSTNILVKGAENNLLPKLDMNVNLGYSGLDEGRHFSNFTTSLTNNVPGASVSLSLRYEWPFNNSSARGLLVQNEALHRQAIITADNLARNISSAFTVALSSLDNNMMRLTKAQESVHSYEKSLNNEKQKFRLGMTTLLDLIVVEDRLTSALLNEITVRRDLAGAVARLRFETGTLLTAKDDRISLGFENLTSVPFYNGNGLIHTPHEH